MNQLYSNRQIIDRIKQGDGAILKYWYSRDYTYISSYILKNNGTTDDAKELYQDAFMIVYQKIIDGSFKLNASIRTFLYTVARNLWLKKLRDNKKNNTIEDIESLQIVTTDNDYNWEIDDQEKKVIEKLNQLGENCQKLLQLYYYNKKSLREIATILVYKDEKNARNAKYKCMQRLRRFFDR